MNIIKLALKLNKYKKIDKLGKNKLDELKLKKLRSLLLHTYNHSEYYKGIFKNNNIDVEMLKNFRIEDLSKLPIITKEEYVENYEKIVTDKSIKLDEVMKFDEENEYKNYNKKLYLDKYHIIHTSGTEGKPFYVLYDEDAWENTVFGIIRIALWDMHFKDIIKYILGDVRVVNLMSSDGRYAGCTSISDGLDILNMKYKNIDVAKELSVIKEEMINFNPNVIISYVSILEILADYIVENNIKLNVDRVITCGEPLSDDKREKLEKIFKVKIIDCYGASESIAIGVENDINEGMYLLDDLNIVEIEKDAIYLTNLNNYTMPFIRYEIKDVVEKIDKNFDIENIDKENNHKTKLPYTRIKKVRGRSSDILWLSNNKDFIHPLQIEGYRLKGMNDFQIVKTSENSFYVNVKMNDEEKNLKEKYFDDVKKVLSECIKEILDNKNLNEVKFEIKEVDKIEIDPINKKKKFIINNIKQ